MLHRKLKPIIKWSGGRTSISNMVISCLPNNCKNYWEPFVGNAAVALRIYNYDNFVEKLYLSDTNIDLVNFYQWLRAKPVEVIGEVKRLASEFNAAVDREAAYYKIRSYYNDLSVGEEKAVYFYLLNQTCYNGMMRSNKKGNLNAAYSGRKCETYEDNMKAFADFLRDERVIIEYADFDVVDPEPQDMVFLAPPDRYCWYAENGQKLQGLWEAWSSKNVCLILTGRDEELLYKMFSGWYFMAVGKRMMVLNY